MNVTRLVLDIKIWFTAHLMIWMAQRYTNYGCRHFDNIGASTMFSQMFFHPRVPVASRLCWNAGECESGVWGNVERESFQSQVPLWMSP